MKWGNEKSIEELDKLFYDLRKLVEEKLFPMAKKHENAEAAELLREAWLRLRQGPVRVLFLGASSAGKSTFVNAASGWIIVPEGLHTTSPIPVWVKAGRSAKNAPTVDVIKTGSPGGLPVVEHVSSGGFIMNYCYTPEQAASGEGQELYKDVVSAIIDLPGSSKLPKGVTLIDAPGRNSSAGDNDRFDEVLGQGCEMIVVVFQKIIQSDTEFLREKISDCEAPFRRLLEDGRVFVVQNRISHSTIADAKANMKNIFGLDMPKKMFYSLNALEERIKSADTYNYTNLLRGVLTRQEQEDADALFGLELQMQRKMKSREPCADFKRLCEDLGAECRRIVEDPEKLRQLMEPIQKNINKAVELLSEDFTKGIAAVKAGGAGADESKTARLRSLREELEKLEKARACVAEAMSTESGSELSELLKSLRSSMEADKAYAVKRAELRGYKLISDELFNENAELHKGMELAGWPLHILNEYVLPRSQKMSAAFVSVFTGEDYMKKRAAGLAGSCRKLLDELDKKMDINEKRADGKRMGLGSGELEDIQGLIRGLCKESAAAAVDADFCRPDEGFRNRLTAWLKVKRDKINKGRFGGKYTKFMLDVSLNSDVLDPFMKKEIELAADRYANEFIQRLGLALYAEAGNFEAELGRRISACRLRADELEKKIAAEVEAAQRLMIDELERRQKALTELRLEPGFEAAGAL